MSNDNIYGADSQQPRNGSDFGEVEVQSIDFDSEDVAPADIDGVLTGRARAQQRLAQVRTSAWDATTRARAAAAARRSPRPADDSVDVSADTLADDTLTDRTLAEKAQAYRVHLLSAAAAVAALLVAVIRSRAAKRHAAEATIDLGEWRLHAEPLDQ